ncbi:proto-oncogene Mas-like [Phalacrocorax aristotelis]|uniref:proto-oncogene Mas-like n=1 Tax=Phalacrocorax aristotelis TaxID=126867 RepID=UPI003F4BC3E7
MSSMWSSVGPLTRSPADTLRSHISRQLLSHERRQQCLQGQRWLLGFRIRRNPITVYILNLAIADFTFLLFIATSALLYIVENVFCSTDVLKYQRLLLLSSLFSYNMGLYLLTAISIERCVSVLCSSTCRPQHLSVMVCALLWALSITVIATVTTLCLLHEHEHCQKALISMYVLNFLIFAPPMVISSTILFIKVLCGSQRRQYKRLYIVIFLIVLFFLLFALPLSIWHFLKQVSYIAIMPSQIIFLLACINSSIKPFIYFLVGSCQRHCSLASLRVAFRRVFEEPEYDAACSNDTVMETLAPAS